MKKFQGKILVCVFACLLAALMSCASQYKFISQPSEANVFYLNGSQKTAIGQTPIEFAKNNLPDDIPFIITFEKAGFETKEVAVSPSDNSLTTISANLKPSLTTQTDAITKRMRTSIQKIFEVQELTAQKRYVDALATLKELESSEPLIAEIYVLRGSLYVLLNDSAKAREEWERALKLDPSLEALRARIAKLSEAQGVKP